MQPYYQDAAVTLYHGDCREILPALEQVDHVITDPPYSEHVHGKSRRGGADAPPKDGSGRMTRANFSRVKNLGFEAIDNGTMQCCAHHFARLSRRWVLVFSDVELAPRWRSKLTRSGLEYVRTGFWRKVGGTPQFTGDRPAIACEAITITMCHPKGRKQWNGGGHAAFWEHAIVLNRSHKDPRLHTTQKPEGLFRDLLLDFTLPGDVVLDAFAGSGTMGAACKRLGRRAVLIEGDERYCEATAQRCEQARIEPSLFPSLDVRAKQRPLELGA